VGPAVPGSKCVADSFAPEQSGEILVVGPIGIVPADGEDNILVFQGSDAVGIVLVGDVVAGVIEVDVVVIVAVGELANVIKPAHTEGPAHAVRITQRKVDGMVGPKAGPRANNERIRVQLLGERQDFIADIEIVLGVALGPLARGSALAVPALAVY